MPSILVPNQNKKLSDFETLLNEQRVEKIFYQLMELVPRDKRHESLAFATYVQPLTDRTNKEYAVFLVKSLHPKQRFIGQELVTLATVPLDEWKAVEKERYHYVGIPDPAKNIFAGLLRRHLRERKDLSELIDKPLKVQ